MDFEESDSVLKSEFNVTTESTPLDILEQFLTNDVIEEVVLESNRYKDQVYSANRKSFPHWTPITLAEFWQFLAVCLLMGLVKKPAVPDYWTTNHLFSTPSFGEIMSRNR